LTRKGPLSTNDNGGGNLLPAACRGGVVVIIDDAKNLSKKIALFSGGVN
jgi:hypothetical protein